MPLHPQIRALQPLSLGLGSVLLTTLLAANQAQANGPTNSDTQVLSWLQQQSISVSGTASVYPGPTIFTVQPFQSSLGQLLSASISWDTQASGSATVGTASGGGAWGLEFGGTVTIDDFAYGGYGGGDGFGGGQGETLMIAVPSSGTVDTFTQANTNVWSAFTGNAPYSLAYRGSYFGLSPYRITATNIASSDTQLLTEAEVTYFYQANPPQPSVPGPVPTIGVAIGWQWSRAIRRRASGKRTSNEGGESHRLGWAKHAPHGVSL